MKKESIMTGIIGLLIGSIIASLAAKLLVNYDNHSMMRMVGINANHSHEQPVVNHDEMSMADMTKGLKNKTGDEFDKAFIEMMIVHHEGAVAMAELIPAQAKHDEIRNLGKAIISAQTKEISEMRQWQQNWGYSSGEMNQTMHGGH